VANNSKPVLILFVRHGHTETTGKILPGRTKGLNLSNTGIEQANRVAEQIKDSGTKPSAIYSSPMERTQQTAKPIAKVLGLKNQINKGLNEADFGKWTGRKLSDLRKLQDWKKVQNNPSEFRFPEGESFFEMQGRIVKAVEGIVKKHAGETVVCVSHADMIKSIIAHGLGMHLDNFQRLAVSPCSISAIQFGSQKPNVLFINNVGKDLPNLGMS